MDRKEHDPFYDSPRWKRLRRSVMIRAHYQDEYARRYSPVPKQAEIVHHIFPREEFPEYQYCKWNLIAVSKATHNKLHYPDGNLTPRGVKLLERTARREGIEIPLRYLGRHLPPPGG